MAKEQITGWMNFEKKSTCFQYTGKLIIRPIFSKRKYLRKTFPNCKCSKVCITIEEVSKSG